MGAFMSRLGLDSRAFVMQLVGFGCNVPALIGTRVMRSRGLLLLTMLIILFSLCSARLQVFMFGTTAVFSPSSALYRKRLSNTEPLLLELPPYRIPTSQQMLVDGWREAGHFVKGASIIILLGMVAVWFLIHYSFAVPVTGADTLAGQLMGWQHPLLTPIGIDHLMTLALVFGCIANEAVFGALAVIYGAGEHSPPAGMIAAQYTWIQAYSFMLFVLTYTPYLSTFAVLRQESKN